MPANLKNQTHLNGQTGYVVMHDYENMLIGVKLVKLDKEVSVKPENVVDYDLLL